MTTVIVTAILTTLCIVLIAYAWRQHAQLERLRIDAQTADAWADYWEHSHARLRSELDSLHRMHDHLQALYCDLVRDRLARNYWIIHDNRRQTPP